MGEAGVASFEVIPIRITNLSTFQVTRYPKLGYIYVALNETTPCILEFNHPSRQPVQIHGLT